MEQSNKKGKWQGKGRDSILFLCLFISSKRKEEYVLSKLIQNLWNRGLLSVRSFLNWCVHSNSSVKGGFPFREGFYFKIWSMIPLSLKKSRVTRTFNVDSYSVDSVSGRGPGLGSTNTDSRRYFLVQFRVSRKSNDRGVPRLLCPWVCNQGRRNVTTHYHGLRSLHVYYWGPSL